MRVASSCLLLGVLVLASVGCEPPKPKAKPAASGPVIAPSGDAKSSIATSSAAGPRIVASLTQEQMQAFVDRLSSYVAGTYQANDFVDTDRLFQTVADRAGIPATERTAFLQASQRNYAAQGHVNELRTHATQGGSVKFLRFKQREGVTRPLFRVILSNRTVTYMEFELFVDPKSGKIVASDVYQYSTGEWSSETFTASALQIMSVKDPSALGRLFRGVGLQSDDASKLMRFLEAAKAQNFENVLTSYASLPQAMKDSKFCLLVRYNAASRLARETEIVASVGDLRRLFPSDACVNFLSIDFFALRNELGKAMAAIDGLEQLVEGDPYLSVLRAGILLRARDFEAAITSATKGRDQEPSLVIAHLALAQALQGKSDFAAMAAAFRVAQTAAGVTPNMVASMSEFAPFVASPEFQAWQAGR